jgi:hypothetical protein
MPVTTSSTTIQTSLKVVKDIGEALEKIPYVKSVAGIAIQIMEIREVCSISLSFAYPAESQFNL